MQPNVKELGIDRLSVAERLQLIEEIWDSITEQLLELEIPQSHKEELDRRIAAHEAAPGDSSPWSEVKARVLQRLESKG